MSAPDHTPTPWWFEAGPAGGSDRIRTSRGRFGASVGIMVEVPTGPDMDSIASGDALYQQIIHEHNCHEELVAALCNTADALEVFAGIAPILRADEAWKAAVGRARAALAKAGRPDSEATK